MFTAVRQDIGVAQPANRVDNMNKNFAIRSNSTRQNDKGKGGILWDVRLM
jgi:hypothetical protein